MGTVLSLSPGSRKSGYYDNRPGSLSHYPSISSRSLNSQKDRGLKRGQSIFLPALTWKRLVASTKKKGNSKKGPGCPAALGEPLNNNNSINIYQNDPLLHLNCENVKKSLSCANLSSYEGPAGLGLGLGYGMGLGQGHGYAYSKSQLLSSVSYSYMGNEISYPLKPFLVEVVFYTQTRINASQQENRGSDLFYKYKLESTGVFPTNCDSMWPVGGAAAAGKR
ncbi:uncharacterized protein LOC133026142 [Limanda limanda]|uniref:uncharacterized protein LOC133026142 n=1 Tax=Limanda limanda TaxID=27771 RepID=UPI0029C92AEF|nr:uncharacterized protein LOC133026142 [Limanda limanda]